MDGRLDISKVNDAERLRIYPAMRRVAGDRLIKIGAKTLTH